MSEDFRSPPAPGAQEALQLLFNHPDKGWSRFWSVYGEVAKSRIRRFRFRPEDASDVLQEVTLRLVKNDFKVLRNWDPERGPLEAYLTVIITSVSLDYIRKTKPFDEEQVDVRDTRGGPSDPFRKKELLEILLRVLNQWSQDGLHREDRALIEGRLNQKEYSEIAQSLGITEQNAMTRFSRLRKDLKKKLENAGIRKEDLEWEDWKKNL